MDTTKVSAHWTGEALTYIGTNEKGNEVTMGGQGVPPTHMMLMGLAGCMGMDILSILQKKRLDVTDVAVEVIGYRPEDYPRPYHTIELAFKVTGNNLSDRAVARAIDLSMTKYCVVGQTLQNKTEIKPSFTIVDA